MKPYTASLAALNYPSLGAGSTAADTQPFGAACP